MGRVYVPHHLRTHPEGPRRPDSPVGQVRVYELKSCRLDRKARFCEGCAQSYREDTIHWADGGYTVLRTACACTPAGRSARHGRPEGAGEGHDSGHAQGGDTDRNPDLDPPG